MKQLFYATNPLEEVLREVDERQPQLLVLGSRARLQSDTRHRSGLALQCVSKSTSDVLVDRPGQPDPFRSMVVGVDYSPASMLAVRRAVDLARSSGASLEFVHVVQIPVVGENVHDSAPQPRSLENLESWLRRVIGIDHKGLEFRCTVRTGTDIGAALIDHLHDARVELVVAGASTTVDAGLTLNQLVKASPASILAVKLPECKLVVSTPK